MGMFDDIRCEYPLPDKEVQDESFQTKSLCCAMDAYTITKEGTLVEHTVTYKEVPEEERPYYGTSEWEHQKMCGSIEPVSTGDKVLDDYHGDIFFYTDKDEMWYEFRARFSYGKLDSIILINKRKLKPYEKELDENEL